MMKYLYLILSLTSSVLYGGMLQDLINIIKPTSTDVQCAQLANLYRLHIRNPQFNHDDSKTLESVIRTCLYRRNAFSILEKEKDKAEIERHKGNIKQFEHKIAERYKKFFNN